MAINQEQAEKCRDIGAAALRQGDYEKAVRMLEKSLRLHVLPGVDALLSHARSKVNGGSADDIDDSNTRNGQQQRQSASSSSSSIPTRQQSTASAASASSSRTPTTTTGADGRTYTPEQVQTIQRIVKAKKSGRGAHYRVLDLDMGAKATENDIKKAYRKISLKVHPDKNSAPGADEAFKAVGLAYATLSDKQKRHIYDQYGDEDPDSNQGSGMSGFHRRRTGGGGQTEVSPEDIFNAFFGGGMPGGGGGQGFHVYSSGFGPGGMHFNVGGNNANRRRQQQQQQQRQQQQNPDAAAPNAGLFLQFLPILIILLTSFFRNGGQQDPTSSSSTFSYTNTSPGENKYFSLTNKHPFTNRLQTRYTPVKDIPYYVSDSFLRTYNRDRYQLGQVERMVENSYEQYLVRECTGEQKYKRNLQQKLKDQIAVSQNKYNNDNNNNIQEQERLQKLISSFSYRRCEELHDLFPNNKNNINRI